MTKKIKKQRKEDIEKELKKQEKEGKTDDYIKKNKGYITASKLKCFINNPQEYQLKFQKGIIRGEGKRYFKMGNAFDCLVSYGTEEFFNQYREKLYKRHLKEMLSDDEYTSKTKKAELLKKAGMNDKKVLTKKQMKTIKAMYEEVSRQPLIHPDDDGENTFENQVVVNAEYKNLKLKGTLDRLSIKLKQIRDRKTTGKLENFIYNIKDYGYNISMAMYYLLTKIDKGIECDSFLDIVERSRPAKSRVIQLDKSNLARIVKNKIKPGLDKLIEFEEEYGEDEIRPAIYPLSGANIPREEIEKSDYYDILPCSIQTRMEYFG